MLTTEEIVEIGRTYHKVGWKEIVRKFGISRQSLMKIIKDLRNEGIHVGVWEMRRKRFQMAARQLRT